MKAAQGSINSDGNGSADHGYFLFPERLLTALGGAVLDAGLAAAFAAGFAGALEAGFLPFAGSLGGGAVTLVGLGGTARIRHLGPEPMRSSR